MAASRRKILDLDVTLVGSLPECCSSCCFWESDGAGAPGRCIRGCTKESWISECLTEGVGPGKLVQSDSVTIGYVQYAPVPLVPRLSGMPYPPPSRDAVYITCLYVLPELRGRGIGRLLMESVERAAHRKKYRLLESHGRRPGAAGPPAPAGFFERCGFKVVSPHLEAPLVRMDLRALLPLQESLQSLLEIIPLPSMARAPVPRPEPPARSLAESVSPPPWTSRPGSTCGWPR